MKPNRLTAWMEATACPRLPPDRDRRVGDIARRLARSMVREGHFFIFRDAVEFLAVPPEDVDPVRDRVYELAFKRLLEQGPATVEAGRPGLRWIARNLGLSGEQAGWVELRVGRRLFEEYLAFALAGGRLDPDELEHLRAIADGLGVGTRRLLLGCLAESGGRLLKRFLEGLAGNGRIDDRDWALLLETVAALGVTPDEFARLLRPHARRLVDRLEVEGRRRTSSTGRVPAAQALLQRL